MNEILSFEALVELEPRLLELEAEIASQSDDGEGSFYCSNYVWLPLNATLRTMVGVARREPGHEALFSSYNYESAYVHLSRQLPGCRGCGCERFQPLRDEQLSAEAW